MKIILGSSSKARQDILREMGYEFEVRPANLDEKAIRTEILHDLPLVLAQAKSEVLAGHAKNSILITSDSVVIHGGQLREKPADKEELRHFLSTYWESPAEVVTAVVVRNTATGKHLEGVESTKIHCAYGRWYGYRDGFTQSTDKEIN
jgi:septum formation protein